MAIEVLRRPPQPVRFLMAGATVMVVYLSLTTLLLHFDAPSQVALAVGYFTGVLLHFQLQRRFVWRTERGYALSVASQRKRFAILVAIQYAVTALSLGLLPHALGVPRIEVYLATVATVTLVTFTIMRLFLFHPAQS